MRNHIELSLESDEDAHAMYIRKNDKGDLVIYDPNNGNHVVSNLEEFKIIIQQIMHQLQDCMGEIEEISLIDIESILLEYGHIPQASKAYNKRAKNIHLILKAIDDNDIEALKKLSVDCEFYFQNINGLKLILEYSISRQKSNSVEFILDSIKDNRVFFIEAYIYVQKNTIFNDFYIQALNKKIFDFYKSRIKYNDDSFFLVFENILDKIQFPDDPKLHVQLISAATEPGKDPRFLDFLGEKGIGVKVKEERDRKLAVNQLSM